MSSWARVRVRLQEGSEGTKEEGGIRFRLQCRSRRAKRRGPSLGGVGVGRWFLPRSLMDMESRYSIVGVDHCRSCRDRARGRLNTCIIGPCLSPARQRPRRFRLRPFLRISRHQSTSLAVSNPRPGLQLRRTSLTRTFKTLAHHRHYPFRKSSSKHHRSISYLPTISTRP